MMHVGGYHEYCGGVQYRGGSHEYRGVFSTVGDIMIHVEEYHDACGGMS